MSNAFEKAFGIPLPKCCSLGECCKGASPSKPFHQLMQRAAAGDEFARNFFSIMIPYPTQAAAEMVVPGLVKRMRQAAEKLPDFDNPSELVFYHCRYLTAENTCGVHEDRPQFCRDYPDTPFVVTAPGCAFEGWVAACKSKYHQIKQEVSQLKDLKADLESLRSQHPSASTENLTETSANFRQAQDLKLIPDGLSMLPYLPKMTHGAPLGSIWLYL